jgi:hypothetical protein
MSTTKIINHHRYKLYRTVGIKHDINKSRKIAREIQYELIRKGNKVVWISDTFDGRCQLWIRAKNK